MFSFCLTSYLTLSYNLMYPFSCIPKSSLFLFSFTPFLPYFFHPLLLPLIFLSYVSSSFLLSPILAFLLSLILISFSFSYPNLFFSALLSYLLVLSSSFYFPPPFFSHCLKSLSPLLLSLVLISSSLTCPHFFFSYLSSSFLISPLLISESRVHHPLFFSRYSHPFSLKAAKILRT